MNTNNQKTDTPLKFNFLDKGTVAPSDEASAKSEDEKILHLLTETFLDNARMRTLIGENASNFKQKVRTIIEYTYSICKNIDGVFFSSNEKTVMLFYQKSEFKHRLRDYFNYLKIALFCVSPSNLVRAFKRERKITQLREQKDDYLYVWFLAQDKNYSSLDGLREAKHFLMNKVEALQLPILVETTDRRLLIIYKRLGFDIYRHWKDKKTDTDFWFAKKEIAEAA